MINNQNISKYNSITIINKKRFIVNLIHSSIAVTIVTPFKNFYVLIQSKSNTNKNSINKNRNKPLRFDNKQFNINNFIYVYKNNKFDSKNIKHILFIVFKLNKDNKLFIRNKSFTFSCKEKASELINKFYHNKKYIYFKNILAGGISGIACNAMLYVINTYKTCFDTNYVTPFQIKNSKIFLMINIQKFISRGLFFGSYDTIKHKFLDISNQRITVYLIYSYILAYFVSVYSSVCAYPFYIFNKELINYYIDKPNIISFKTIMRFNHIKLNCINYKNKTNTLYNFFIYCRKTNYRSIFTRSFVKGSLLTLNDLFQKTNYK